MSYTIDVYRGDAPATRNFVDFACFVSLFPQLVAGPIVRYAEVARPARGAHAHAGEKFARGVAFFALGLAKKVLLANPCGKVADTVLRRASSVLAARRLVRRSLAYAFQIYFDFSGYSDMAIGLGLMIGFVFPKNFDSPYRSALDHRVLAALAHLALDLAARLPLHPARRQPEGAAAHLRQPDDRDAARRPLARRVAELRRWGAIHGAWLALERARGRRSLAAGCRRRSGRRRPS